jgi:hypothetical protein
LSKCKGISDFAQNAGFYEGAEAKRKILAAVKSGNGETIGSLPITDPGAALAARRR